MNGRDEGKALAAIKIGFDAAGARARGGVEMNTDENGVAVGVGDGHARSEWHEDIGVAGHDDAITARLQHVTKPQRDVERHGFFRHALTRNPAAIKAAVAGVDYDNG